MMVAEPTVAVTVNYPSIPLKPDNLIAPDNPNAVLLLFQRDCVNLTLEVGQEIILGRIHPTNAVEPQVDLTTYGGCMDGVSRLHAALTRDVSGWYLTDLESSNGTWVNGTRIAPYVPYRLMEVNDIRFTHLEVKIVLPDSSSPESHV